MAIALFRTIFLSILFASTAKADCVWIPICMPYKTPAAEALRIYIDGVQVREIRPMWAPAGGRTNFYQCGPSGGRITASIVRAGILEPLVWVDDGAANVTDCTTTGTPVATPAIRSFYGIREQTLRAIKQLYTLPAGAGRPIDTDRDGTIRANDMQLIWDHILGRFPDATDNICVSETPGACQ